MKNFLPTCSICMLTVAGASSSHPVPFRIMIALNAMLIVVNTIHMLMGAASNKE